VKAELLKRMFRAIRANAQASATATEDEVAVEKLLDTIVREERQKGHTLLADQLENITKSKPSNPEPAPTLLFQPLLPTSKRSQLPLLTIIPREKLRHHTILAPTVEDRFRRIEKEYAARDRFG
jgi:hypothetical protein